MLDVTLTVLSFPFWFIALVFTVVGIFGTVKVKGERYTGKYYFLIKVGVTTIGLVFGLIAYFMVTVA
jgi:hypothetical protein